MEDHVERSLGITLADLESAIRRVNTVYYVTSQWCPKVDQDGKECVYLLKDPGYYIMHPDNLPKFKAMVEAAGMITEPYDFGTAPLGAGVSAESEGEMSKCKYRGKAIPTKGVRVFAVAGKSSHGGNGEICGALSAQGDPCPLCWQPDTAEADCPTAQEAAESE